MANYTCDKCKEKTKILYYHKEGKEVLGRCKECEFGKGEEGEK